MGSARPEGDGVWLLSVPGPGADGTLLPIEQALADSRNAHGLEDELVRLEQPFPALRRPGGARRGQVYLAGDEAWALITRSVPSLRTPGFDVRPPALPRPSTAARLTPSTSSWGVR